MGEKKLDELFTAEDLAARWKFKKKNGDLHIEKVWALDRSGSLRSVPGVKPKRYTLASVEEFERYGTSKRRK